MTFFRVILAVLFLIPYLLNAKAGICLNMIVKNESKVIERCIKSVLPLIDYWVIVDTGSTDGTQDVIKAYMKENGIPGELHERPWVDFSHNRNEAISLAKGKADYLLFIDADEYLEYEPDFQLPLLDKDYYYIRISHSGSVYNRVQLVKTGQDWEYVGVLHEVIGSKFNRTSGTLDKVMNIYTTEGARSKDPRKYHKDAEILERALKEEPNNSRYVFYLAQSYRDAKMYEKALTNYEKRVTMGGWQEEVFFALLQIGVLKEVLEYPDKEIIQSYLKAYTYRSSRIEPLYYLARYFRNQENYEAGYRIGKLGQSLPPSKDILFVQKWIQDYGLALEYSICAYWADHFEECKETCVDILKMPLLPENIRECVERNLGFANGKLLEEICQTQ